MTDNNGTSFNMPVMPAYGYGYGGGNNGGLFGGDWWGIILVILLLGGGMWGGFGGMGGFGGFGNMMLGYDFPWLLNGQQGINANTNAGFRDAMLNDGITSIRDGISGLSTQLCGCCGDMQMAMANGFSGVQQSLCNGFAGTTAAITGAQNALAQQLYSNEIANLNRSFAEQTANAQGFNAVQNQLAQCCCDNRLATCQTQNLIQADGEATRNAILTGVQSIKDQLCQDKIDSKNDEIAQLRQTIAMKDLAASQTAQNAFIQHGFSKEVDDLYTRLSNCPVPSTPVFGRTPIFTCNGNGNGFGCGCGCAA